MIKNKVLNRIVEGAASRKQSRDMSAVSRCTVDKNTPTSAKGTGGRHPVSRSILRADTPLGDLRQGGPGA